MLLQIINILTLGSPDGIGCFFPKGFLGKINKPTGYDASASGTTAWDASGPPKVAVQVNLPIHWQPTVSGSFGLLLALVLKGSLAHLVFTGDISALNSAE